MSFLRRFSLALLVLLMLAYVMHQVWMPSVAQFLIRVDPLEQAEIIVVLAGDGTGNRALEAARLVEEGYAPLALLNGTSQFYQVRECDAVVEFARNKGVRGEMLEPFCFDAHSTLEEAAVVDKELRRRGIKTAIVVTSDFHTRRAARIFRGSSSGEVQYRFASCPTQNFDPETWWTDREARGVVAVEYLKTLHSWLEQPR